MKDYNTCIKVNIFVYTIINYLKWINVKILLKWNTVLKGA